MRIIEGNSTAGKNLLTPTEPQLEPVAVSSRPRKMNRRKWLIITGLTVVLLAVSIGGFLFIRNYNQLRSFKDERDVSALTKRLGKHLELPSDEPIIATVTDVEKLKSEQAFYRNAKNGDKIFIWKDKALIYRAEADKIIDFGIIVTQKSDATTPTTSPTPTAVKK